MKKLMVCLLVGCLVLLVSSMAFAGTIPGLPVGNTQNNSQAQGSITLEAVVEKCASITFGPSDPPSIVFHGNEDSATWVGGSANFAVDTNCDIYINGYSTPFTLDGGNIQLTTQFRIVPCDGDQVASTWQLNDQGDAYQDAPYVDTWAPDYPYVQNKVYYGNIDFRARLVGQNVSNQPAGTYHATYKLIASALAQ